MVRAKKGRPKTDDEATTSAMQLVGDAGADAGGVAAPSGAPASAAMDIDEEAPRGGQDDSRNGGVEAPSATGAQLPPHLQDRHDYLTSGPDMNFNTSTQTSASTYMPIGVDNAWSNEAFDAGFSIQATPQSKQEPNDLTFDVRGIDPAIANALRRILIAEVPTVAIEHVYFINNTSIIADEMLAHRLGLVPLKVDPRRLNLKSAQAAPSEKDTVVFKLKVDCKWKDKAAGEMENEKVYSSQLEWLPNGSELLDETRTVFGGSQEAVLPEGAGVVESDILLAKLRPGQSIELEAHAVKGTGEEHAKWSPVATAWYRLNPEVVVIEPITGADADELVAEFADAERGSLFRLEGSGPGRQAVVTSARGNEHQLEKLRRLTGEEKWKGRLQLRKRKDHFIFTVQSTGALPPQELFVQAIDILSGKADKLLEQI